MWFEFELARAFICSMFMFYFGFVGNSYVVQ